MIFRHKKQHSKNLCHFISIFLSYHNSKYIERYLAYPSLSAYGGDRWMTIKKPHTIIFTSSLVRDKNVVLHVARLYNMLPNLKLAG